MRSVTATGDPEADAARLDRGARPAGPAGPSDPPSGEIAPVHLVSSPALARAAAGEVPRGLLGRRSPRQPACSRSRDDDERSWVGRMLRVGDAVLEVTRTPKHCLGVYADVRRAGRAQRRGRRPALACRRAQPRGAADPRCAGRPAARRVRGAGPRRRPPHPPTRRTPSAPPSPSAPRRRRASPSLATGDVLIHQDLELTAGCAPARRQLRLLRRARAGRPDDPRPPTWPSATSRRRSRPPAAPTAAIRASRCSRRSSRRWPAPGFDECSTASNHSLDDGTAGAGPHPRRPRRRRDRARRHLPDPGGEPDAADPRRPRRQGRAHRGRLRAQRRRPPAARAWAVDLAPCPT